VLSLRWSKWASLIGKGVGVPCLCQYYDTVVHYRYQWIRTINLKQAMHTSFISTDAVLQHQLLVYYYRWGSNIKHPAGSTVTINLTILHRHRSLTAGTTITAAWYHAKP